MTENELRMAARRGFREGNGWIPYSKQYGKHFTAVAGGTGEELTRLVDRLRSIVVSGSSDGLYGPADPDGMRGFRRADEVNAQIAELMGH